MATAKFTPIPKLSKADIQRFERHVDKRGPRECWPWKAARDHGGYGVFSIGPSQFRSPRIAYFLHSRKDPGSLYVCHSCDNPGCCNWSHLFKGTSHRNRMDAVQKGHCRGERIGTSVLKESQVIESRKLYKTGAYSVRELALRFSMTEGGLRHALHGRSWGHLSGAISKAVNRKWKRPGNRKLKEEDVVKIRQSYVKRLVTLEELASKFGVAFSTIHAIVKRKTWTDLHI